MEFYEFAKQILVYAGFGAFVGMAVWTYGYGIYELLVLVRKKFKARKEKKAVEQHENN